MTPAMQAALAATTRPSKHGARSLPWRQANRARRRGLLALTYSRLLRRALKHPLALLAEQAPPIVIDGKERPRTAKEARHWARAQRRNPKPPPRSEPTAESLVREALRLLGKRDRHLRRRGRQVRRDDIRARGKQHKKACGCDRCFLRRLEQEMAS